MVCPRWVLNRYVFVRFTDGTGLHRTVLGRRFRKSPKHNETAETVSPQSQPNAPCHEVNEACRGARLTLPDVPRDMAAVLPEAGLFSEACVKHA